MILASLLGGGPDGTLVVVSPDRTRFALPPDGPRTLQEALDRWDVYEPQLRSVSTGTLPVADAVFASPLPRAFHWAEGSCYLPHMERIRGARGEPLPVDHRTQPKIYQSGSDQHLPPVSEFKTLDPDWELDLEATIVVFTGADAGVALVGLTNDLTYRHHIVAERREGSGIYHSKPGRAYAPFVVTPDALPWNGVSLHARVETRINGDVLGEPWADVDLAFDFGTILERLTLTRSLAPGSIVGTGTVANAEQVGCIAEQRALDGGATDWLHPGDVMAIEAFDEAGTSLFGRIEQTVV